MKPHQKRLNDYIRRMVEDMRVRNFADATIDAYTKSKIQKAVTPHTHCRIHDRRPCLLESDDSQQRARRDLLGKKPRPPQQVATVHSQGP